MSPLDNAYQAPFANIKMECQKGPARNAFYIGEVWNPVCSHGKKQQQQQQKAVKLVLWKAFSRILLPTIKDF